MSRQYVRHSPELEAEILHRIARGEFLTDICDTPGMPEYTSPAKRWKDTVDGYAERYKDARDEGFDRRAQEALKRLYSTPGVIVDERGNTRIDPAWVALVKTQFWAEMEALKRWDPERYGEKIALNHGAQQSLVDVMELARQRVQAIARDARTSAGEATDEAEGASEE